MYPDKQTGHALLTEGPLTQQAAALKHSKPPLVPGVEVNRKPLEIVHPGVCNFLGQETSWCCLSTQCLQPIPIGNRKPSWTKEQDKRAAQSVSELWSVLDLGVVNVSWGRRRHDRWSGSLPVDGAATRHQDDLTLM